MNWFFLWTVWEFQRLVFLCVIVCFLSVILDDSTQLKCLTVSWFYLCNWHGAVLVILMMQPITAPAHFMVTCLFTLKSTPSISRTTWWSYLIAAHSFMVSSAASVSHLTRSSSDLDRLTYVTFCKNMHWSCGNKVDWLEHIDLDLRDIWLEPATGVHRSLSRDTLGKFS